jgi:RNA polymerase sigma factor (sigma-70 family)
VGNDFDSPTDAALWQRTVNHDGGAFGDLFERHGDAVYNHCFRRTASWAVAEDLASIVWLETWRRRKDVQLYGESLLPWLLTTANNCLRNFNRSQRRYYHFLAGLPTMKSMEDFGDESAQRMDDERQMSRVLAAMSKLRLEEQEVVALCDWSGLTYEATAAAIGKPVGTVKSRLSRAHNHLRTALGGEIADNATSRRALVIHPAQEGEF